ELRLRGATVMSLDEPDAVAQATAANHFAADVYLGFETQTDPAALIQFYRVPSFESAGGRALAELIAEKFACIGELEPDVRGMRLPMLREMRPYGSGNAPSDVARDPDAGRPMCGRTRPGGHRCRSSHCRRHHRGAGTVCLTIYLNVYPQPFPPGVCNAQLDTSVMKSTHCVIYITLRGGNRLLCDRVRRARHHVINPLQILQVGELDH